MSQMVVELYEALRKAGVDEELSKEAARAVLPGGVLANLATKADVAELRVAMAEMESRIIKWNVGAIAVMTAIFAAIVRLG